MKWFGEPWPSAELRASVCEDDADRVPVPVGEECTLCTEDILEGDRGVVLAHLEVDEVDPHLTWIQKRNAHINCLIQNVGGVPVDERS